MIWQAIGNVPKDERTVVFLCALSNGQYREIVCQCESGVFESLTGGLNGQYDPRITLAVAWAPFHDEKRYAERYRWLRQGNAYYPEENRLRGWEELDEGIDAEMAREQQL